MKAYHRTYYYEEILREGFLDATGTYLTMPPEEFTGVWISDRPLDISEGADGDVFLVLDIPEEIFAKYEWVEDEKPYREALVPAEILNPLPSPTIADDPT
jgi:hypothetical protein